MAINNKIRQSKDRLQPRIQELRGVRARYAQQEEDYLERKRGFDAATQDVQSRRSLLERDVGEQRSELGKEESRLYLLNCQMAVLDVVIKRATNPAEVARLKDKYTKRLQEQERQSHQLLGKQREVKDYFGNNQAQLGMVAELARLLQCKLGLIRGGGGGGLGGGLASVMAPVYEGTVGGANVMTLS